jgi:AraC-like DNA-binding protein
MDTLFDQIIPAASFERVPLQVLQPSHQLAEWVQCIWVMPAFCNTGDSVEILEKFYPDAGSSLTFQIGPNSAEAYFLQNNSVLRYAWQLSKLHISIRFNPGGAWALLKLPVSELTDQEVDLRSLISSRDSHFQRLMDELPTQALEDQLQAIQTWLQHGKSDLPKHVGHIRELIEHVNHSLVSPIELSASKGMSRRTLERHIRHKFGLSPLQLLNSAKIRRAREMLIRDSHSITDIALSCGFYDQSHFTNFLKEHVGETPLTYKERKLAHISNTKS